MNRLLVCMVMAASLLGAARADAKPKREKAEKVERKRAASDDRADAAYDKAKASYEALKKDGKRRKFRDQWLGVIEQFEAVADKYPNSKRAAQALYKSAELYAELSRVSLATKDLKRAVEAYKRLCDKYPKSVLADDAHVDLGRIYLDRKGDPDAARREFEAALHCKGDMAAEAKAAIAQLPKDATPDRPAKPKADEAPRVAEVRRDERKDVEPKADKAPVAKAADATAVAAALKGADHDEWDSDDDEGTNADDAPASPGKLDPAKLESLKETIGDADVPLSVQVGLKVRRVIIDAGHGGHDTGAIGPGGVNEKDATLAIARKLETRLKAQGFDVLMTRDADKFVALESRAKYANKHKGDLFVSIHCNAHPSPRMRGVETYTLNVTSDRYAMRLAARENAASERTLSDLQFILADLATKANTADSKRLARAVQSSVVGMHDGEKDRPKDLGVKQALFYVLLGARMPAILVETGFISNPGDEKKLGDDEYQGRLADAISEGIGKFIGDRYELARAPTGQPL